MIMTIDKSVTLTEEGKRDMEEKLHYLKSVKRPEIAEKTGLTEESVRVNLCRGMKMLRARLGGKEHG